MRKKSGQFEGKIRLAHPTWSIWHIENFRASLGNPRHSEKCDLLEHFARTFFSCYAIFTWIWTHKTHDLPDYQLTVGSFLPAITYMWSDRQIKGDLNSSNSNNFPPCPALPSQVDFNRAIIFRCFQFDFLCANLATPITSYRLFSNLRCAGHMIHSGNCSPVPSPVGFNRTVISQSLLFEFSCVNPATLIAQDLRLFIRRRRRRREGRGIPPSLRRRLTSPFPAPPRPFRPFPLSPPPGKASPRCGPRPTPRLPLHPTPPHPPYPSSPRSNSEFA